MSPTLHTEKKGFVQFTFVDHEANEFVTLGQSDDLTPEMIRYFYDALPVANDPNSPFLADLWSDGECHDDEKPVSVLAIECCLGRPLDVLLTEGRDEIARLRSALLRRQGGRP